MRELVDVVARYRDRLRAIPVNRSESRPLIGIVGEIFCRLHTFSNENLIERLEDHGGEAWISDFCEWILYTSSQERHNLVRTGQRLSEGDAEKQDHQLGPAARRASDPRAGS